MDLQGFEMIVGDLHVITCRARGEKIMVKGNGWKGEEGRGISVPRHSLYLDSQGVGRLYLHWEMRFFVAI